MENLDAIAGLKSLMIIENTVIMYFFIIFIAGTLIKLFLDRKNPNEVLKNVLDIMKYSVCLAIIGSTTLLAQSGNPEMILNVIVVAYIIISIISVLIHQAITKKRCEDKTDDNIEE